MNEKDAMNRNERLRAVLRGGDPGHDEAGLTTEEAQAMRRTVLSAVPEPRQRFLLAPVFLTSAAAVLSCVVGLSLWRAHDRPAQTVQPLQAARPALPAPQAAPRRQVEPLSEPPVEVAAISPPPRLRRLRPAMKHAPALERPVEQASLAERQETAPQQVQFAAPGGTRIIWLLTAPAAAEGD